VPELHRLAVDRQRLGVLLLLEEKVALVVAPSRLGLALCRHAGRPRALVGLRARRRGEGNPDGDAKKLHSRSSRKCRRRRPTPARTRRSASSADSSPSARAISSEVASSLHISTARRWSGESAAPAWRKIWRAATRF